MQGYSSCVLDHFRRPRNVGVARPCAGSAEASDDRVAIAISVNVRHGRLLQVRFKSSSCVLAVSTGSMLATMAEGLALDDAVALTPQDLASALGEIPEHMMSRCELAVEALRGAIADVRRRGGSDHDETMGVAG